MRKRKRGDSKRRKGERLKVREVERLKSSVLGSKAGNGAV